MTEILLNKQVPEIIYIPKHFNKNIIRNNISIIDLIPVSLIQTNVF